MGAILKQLWINGECRKLVSHKLQRRLVIISVVLGVSVFMIFLGGLMWALIGSNRDPAVNLEALKYVSYAFFGVGGIGILTFCFLWLVYVRDAKFEIRQQELRNAPDMFHFPPQQEQPANATGMQEDPNTQLTDLHSTDSLHQDLQVAGAAGIPPGGHRLPRRPGVVSTSGQRYEQRYDSSSSYVSTVASDRPIVLTAHQLPHLLHYDQQVFAEPRPPRPRAISTQSHSDSGGLSPGLPTHHGHHVTELSRPSSVTTSSSKERFIAV